MGNWIYKLTSHGKDANTYHVHAREDKEGLHKGLYLGCIRFNRRTKTWSLKLDDPYISEDDVILRGHADPDAAVAELLNGYRRYLERSTQYIDRWIYSLGHEPKPLQPIPLRVRLFDAVKAKDERERRLVAFIMAIWRIARREAINELVKMEEVESMDPDQRIGVQRAIKRLQGHPVLQKEEAV